MAALDQKIKNALDEARILVLGSQVLIGFQFRVVFEPGFGGAQRHAHVLLLIATLLMLAGFALVVMPAAYHRIVFRGQDAGELHAFISDAMDWALLPFAIALGLDLFVAVERAGSWPAALAVAIGATTAALVCWWLFPLWRRHTLAPKEPEMPKGPQETPLSQRVIQVLTEARVVLPGAQALLGFQLLTTFSDAFASLPLYAKAVHLGSLVAIATAAVLLMTPAAYHRIVERGEDSERFERLAGAMVLAALAAIGLGLCGELFVVFDHTLHRTGWAAAVASALLALFYLLWFGYTGARRRATISAARFPA